MIHPTKNPTLLVIDDEVLIRRSLVRLLKRQGFETVAAATGQEGLDIVQQQPIALSLVDINLPDMMGHQVVRRIRSLSPHTAVVAITAHGAADVAFEVLREGATDYFEKPIKDWQRFYHVIRKNLEIREKNEQIQRLRERVERLNELHARDAFKEMLGNGEAMNALRDKITQVGPLNVDVLIRGESGVGKEVTARAVHAASHVADGPFVAINCAGLNKEMLESDLFGHEKGAFTGAEKTKPGLCEVAEGGTLFLDEVGELPFDIQAKLLRALNEREFRRVGGTRTLKLKARILSATNVDLQEAISKGQFREDLYFRLNAFELVVPPLREHLEDIPVLTYYFIQLFNQEFKKQVKRISPEALGWLAQQTYRQNNVRELQRFIQRAVILADRAEELTVAMLDTGHRTPPSPEPASAGYPLDVFELDYATARQRMQDEFAREYILRKLNKAHGNITRAAELSGMKRPNFSRAMKRLGVHIENGRVVKG